MVILLMKCDYCGKEIDINHAKYQDVDLCEECYLKDKASDLGSSIIDLNHKLNDLKRKIESYSDEKQKIDLRLSELKEIENGNISKA